MPGGEVNEELIRAEAVHAADHGANLGPLTVFLAGEQLLYVHRPGRRQRTTARRVIVGRMISGA